VDRVPPLTRDAVATKRALLNRWLGQIPNDQHPIGWVDRRVGTRYTC